MKKRNDIYFDITITEKNTGNKVENLTLDEMVEFLGITYRAVAKKACEKGSYKNYIIEAKTNGATTKPKKMKREEPKHEEPKHEEPKHEEPKSRSLLKYCFEAYKMLENGREKYNFKRIEDFIDWLKVNEFVMNELK